MRRMLVALDASPRAKGVLRAALQLGQATGGKLILLRAVGVPVELPIQAYSLPPGSLSELLVNDAERGLGELAREVPTELLGGVRVKLGTPWQAICETAREEEVDLVVIGSHGYGLIDRVLGTTAAKVVNHADRSVLVVRETSVRAAKP
ncbi:MAG: universal stress protein [Deltaproteobacteria bacterium]|nr:universal stress protein [Deltaproteobacteria bacterium]